MNFIKKKIGIITILFFCFWSCKIDESNKFNDSKNKLVISFRFTTNNDFKLKILLNSNSEEQSEGFLVKGNGEEQTIDVPVNKILALNKMRLVLSSREDKTKIIIGKTTFTKGAKQFEIKPKGFWYNFNPNKEIDLKEGSVEFLLSKGNDKSYFITRNLLDNRIASLFKNESPKELLKDSVFRVFVDGFIEKNIKASLLYKNTNGAFDTITKNVLKKTQEQRITFELPKNIVPTQLKLVFSDSSSILPKNIELKRIVLNKNVNRIVIEDTALAVYFNGGRDFKFDTKTRYLRGKQKVVQLKIETRENLESRIINRYLRTSN